jgi:type II secretory pathway pseudopilin PulG
MKVQSSKLNIQGPDQTLRTPHSAFRIPRERGFTYIALLAAIVILGISLAATGKYWSNILQREKEEELLFRGNQYVIAIDRYTNAISGVKRTPSSIDDLLNDSKLMGRHYLRRRYKDPITGEDFVEIFTIIGSQTKQLIGVHSASDKEPLKQSNFPTDQQYFKDFEGKKKYSDWQFVYSSQTPPPVITPPPKP